MVQPAVVLVGTLDTKGDEYAYLRDRLVDAGQDVVIVAGSPPATVGSTNAMRVHRLGSPVPSHPRYGRRRDDVPPEQ